MPLLFAPSCRTTRSAGTRAVPSPLQSPRLWGQKRPVRLMQSPALSHRTALNPHEASGAEELGGARGLPLYGLPEVCQPALNLQGARLWIHSCFQFTLAEAAAV